MSEKLKTVDIKGKPYVEVSERIRHFRDTYEGYRLVSELIASDAESCIFKATVLNPTGDVVATGHAREEKASSYINKTSYIENCETSAWGRALGNFGIGVDASMSIASANEVINAQAQQAKTPVKPTPKPAAQTLPEPTNEQMSVITAIYDKLFDSASAEGLALSVDKIQSYIYEPHKKYPSNMNKVSDWVEYILKSKNGIKTVCA